MRLFSFVFMLCIFCQTVIAYKILGILPTASKSHYYIGHNLLKALAEEGHDVTVISPFKEKDLIPNYKEVFLEHSWIESRRGKRALATHENSYSIKIFRPCRCRKRQFPGLQ